MTSNYCCTAKAVEILVIGTAGIVISGSWTPDTGTAPYTAGSAVAVQSRIPECIVEILLSLPEHLQGIGRLQDLTFTKYG